MTSHAPICGLCDSDDGPGALPATYFCSDDNQHLCETHFNFHQKLTTTSSHTVTCLLNTKGQATTCPHEQNIQFYCKEHMFLCCIGCRRKLHGDCESKIIKFDDYRPENAVKTLQFCKSMLKTLKQEKKKTGKKCCSAKGKETAWANKLTAALKELNRQKEELEQKIEKKVEYVKTAMNRKREEIETKLMGLEKCLENIQKCIGDLETIVNTNGKDQKVRAFQRMFEADEILARCETLISSSESSCHIAFLKLEHNFEAENYVSGTLENLQKAVDQVNKVYSEIQKYLVPSSAGDLCPETEVTEKQQTPQGAETIPKFDYETNRTMVNVIHQTAESAETNVKVDYETTGCKSPMPVHRRAVSSTKADLSGFYQSYENFKLINAEEREQYPSLQIQTQCQINVRTYRDNAAEQCCITGIASLDENYLIMADYANSCLKLFKKSSGLIDYMKFEATPRDIAKISDTKTLVNFPMDKNIQTVTIEHCDRNAATAQEGLVKMVIGDVKIHTEAKCCGIAFHNDKIYAATQLPHQIMIFNAQGQPQSIIPGDKLFDRATYIAINPVNSIIYISDPSHKAIFGINEEGEKKFSYTVDQPHGVACSESGELFVADWETGVHKVSTEGTRVQDLRLASCNCPQKLTFEPSQRLLLVTEWQCDIVQALYLQK